MVSNEKKPTMIRGQGDHKKDQVDYMGRCIYLLQSAFHKFQENCMPVGDPDDGYVVRPSIGLCGKTIILNAPIKGDHRQESDIIVLPKTLTFSHQIVLRHGKLRHHNTIDFDHCFSVTECQFNLTYRERYRAKMYECSRRMEQYALSVRPNAFYKAKDSHDLLETMHRLDRQFHEMVLFVATIPANNLIEMVKNPSVSGIFDGDPYPHEEETFGRMMGEVKNYIWDNADRLHERFLSEK